MMTCIGGGALRRIDGKSVQRDWLNAESLTHGDAVHDGVVGEAIILIHHCTTPASCSSDHRKFVYIVNVVVESSSNNITDRYDLMEERNLAL
jgi:hypothetical protein